jgi:hypothetical protein
LRGRAGGADFDLTKMFFHSFEMVELCVADNPGFAMLHDQAGAFGRYISLDQSKS